MCVKSSNHILTPILFLSFFFRAVGDCRESSENERVSRSSCSQPASARHWRQEGRHHFLCSFSFSIPPGRRQPAPSTVQRKVLLPYRPLLIKLAPTDLLASSERLAFNSNNRNSIIPHHHDRLAGGRKQACVRPTDRPRRPLHRSIAAPNVRPNRETRPAARRIKCAYERGGDCRA